MKLLGADILCTALLLVSSVDAFSFDLSKRALKFDASCNTKYGSLTAKQMIDKSIDFQPKLAKAGETSLDILIAALEFQIKAPGAKKPRASKSELDRIIATYRVIFGDIQAKNADGTPNPNFEAEAKKHITAIKVTRESLGRMTKSGKPNLIFHCDDEWLTTKPPKTAPAKPTKKLAPGSEYLFDTDRNKWKAYKGGKPCKGNKAVVTITNQKGETGPERVTFCKAYLERQRQLEKDKQPQIWDIPKTKLPSSFTTYNQAGKKDATLDFHISAFSTKIGAKWFHEFMHTGLFHPTRNFFKHGKLDNAQGGTGGLAYGFEGAVGLAKHKGIAESSRNIENILYWSLAMYYDKSLWSTGNPVDPSTLAATSPDAPPPAAAAPAANAARAVNEMPSVGGEESEDGDSTTSQSETEEATEGDFEVEVAAKKPSKPTKKPDAPSKTEKPADPPKTDVPPPKTDVAPPKTELPVEPPKTDKPVGPPKTSVATSMATSAAAAPPASSVAPSASAPQTSAPMSAGASATVSASKPTSVVSTKSGASNSMSMSNTLSAANSLSRASCSNTLCTLTSASASSTSSGGVPEETFESEPMNAGSMMADEIIALAGTLATEQIAAMALWDQALVEMDLPTDAELPTETIEGDPTASLGTGLPSATGGLGGASNGTWVMPKLKSREGRNGMMERMMYDYAS